MINLKLIYWKKVEGALTQSCHRTTTKCCCGMGQTVYIFQNGTIADISSNFLTSNSETCVPCDDVLLMHFSLLENSLMIVARNGDMLLAPDSSDDDVRPLGSFGTELETAQWSPDESLLVAISTDHVMTILDTNFDVVCEVNLTKLSAPSEVPLNVGWGTEETQFTGAGAKKIARQQDQLIEKPDGSKNQQEHQQLAREKCSITWRDKSDIFAVSYWDVNESIRKLSVFDREGIYLCSSESKAEVSPGNLIAFRPSGDLIASNGRSASGACVVNFFERNCLIHGSFVVDENKNTSIYQIFYNPSSELLFVFTETLLEPDESSSESSENIKYEMKIYNRRNYHYYLVQSYSLPSKCSDYASDPSRPFYLTVALSNGTLMTFEWLFESAAMSNSSFDLFSVIDGKRLLCTPFGDVLIPPPMSFYELNFDRPILYRFMSGQNLFVVTQDTLHVFECSSNELEDGTINNHFSYGKTEVKYGKFPKLLGKYPLGGLFTSPNFLPFHWFALCSDMIGCVVPTNDDSESQTVVILQIVFSESTIITSNKLKLPVKHYSLAFAPNVSSNSEVYLSMDNGQVSKVSNGELQDLSLLFPKQCNKIYPVTVSDKLFVFGHALNRYLYLNESLISEEVTSFDVQNSTYLLFTTQSHRLFIVRVDQLNQPENGGPIKTDDWYSRKLERGAKIVGVVQSGTAVVLQMPRGNLECIHPKPLLIGLVEQHLDRKEFALAFQACQKHRLDMNIICDRDLISFMSNLEAVFTDVNSHQLVNLFISELTDTNSQLMFQRKSSIPASGKVEQVCNEMIEVIVKNAHLFKCYYLSVVMLYVKLNQPDNALELIKKNDSLDNCKTAGLDFLLLLVDVDKLFDLSLAMYDKQLVLRVLEKSKKDPKEFLPLINNQLFKGDTQEEIRFNIDDYLRNYDKALRSLYVFNSNFDQVFKYVKTHSLFETALEIFLPESSGNWKFAANEYAKDLEKSSKWSKAGCLYAKLKNHLEAFSAFCKAKKFEIALGHFRLLSGKSVPDYFGKREELVSGLEASGNLRAAAELMTGFDEESAIEMLLRNNAWSLASEFVMKSKRANQLMPLLLTSLSSSLGDFDELIRGKSQEVFSLAERFDEVVEKKKQWLALSLEDPDIGAYGDGTISEFSTISKASKRSSSSQGSTSSSRKLNRKKRSLKKNSPEEHLAILDELLKIHALVKKSLESAHELVLVIRSTPELSFDCTQVKGISKSVTELNSTLNRVWSKDEVMHVKVDDFGENVCNFDDCAVKPLSSADLKLFVKPDYLMRDFEI